MLFFLNSAFDTSVQMPLTENVLVYVRTWITWGGLPHLSCKRDQIKMRDCMDRRVTPPRRFTSPTRGPPPAGKQAQSYTTSVTVNHHIYFVHQPLYGLYTENVINFESVFKKKKKSSWKKTGFFIQLSANNDINHNSLIHKLKWFCAIDWIFTRFVTLRYHFLVTTSICRPFNILNIN